MISYLQHVLKKRQISYRWLIESMSDRIMMKRPIYYKTIQACLLRNSFFLMIVSINVMHCYDTCVNPEGSHTSTKITREPSFVCRCQLPSVFYMSMWLKGTVHSNHFLTLISLQTFCETQEKMYGRMF